MLISFGALAAPKRSTSIPDRILLDLDLLVELRRIWSTDSLSSSTPSEASCITDSSLACRATTTSHHRDCQQRERVPSPSTIFSAYSADWPGDPYFSGRHIEISAEIRRLQEMRSEFSHHALVLGIASDFYEAFTADLVTVEILDAREEIWSVTHSRVTDDMCYHLMAPFTMDELCDVVHSLSPSSCPGDGGLTRGFFVTHWELIHVIIAEGKQHALAIGFTKMSAKDIKSINKGIGVDNMHYLNDGLWKTLSLN
ncbi:hypothetical protein L7F22_031371 [Adiantum nelumboides]|nr:hypothetical protein [Adiantum nelumboides]